MFAVAIGSCQIPVSFLGSCLGPCPWSLVTPPLLVSGAWFVHVGGVVCPCLVQSRRTGGAVPEHWSSTQMPRDCPQTSMFLSSRQGSHETCLQFPEILSRLPQMDLDPFPASDLGRAQHFGLVCVHVSSVYNRTVDGNIVCHLLC